MKAHFLDRWIREMEDQLARLEKYLDGLHSVDSAQLNKRSAKLHEEVFEEIDCLECANCCKTTPAILTGKDIKRIAKHLQIPPKIFKRKYLLQDLNGEWCTRRVPCVFLEDDNRCSIYEVRPASCRDYPHTGSGSFRKRIELHKNNLKICPAAFEIVKRMESGIS